MIVWRVAAKFHVAEIDRARERFRLLVDASRRIPGVIEFDVAQDVTDPSVFVSVEVYKDEAAMRRQERLPELAELMALLPGATVSPPRGTIFHVTHTEHWPSNNAGRPA